MDPTTTSPIPYPKPLTIYWVSTPDSPEFTRLSHALTRSSLVALDAEWKPHHHHHHRHHNEPQSDPTFPSVSLLQLACRLADSNESNRDESLVFLVDLQAIPLVSIYGKLKEMFESRNVLKLGFRFKQDLAYLSSTFCSCNGCEPGFDRVEPFIDIASVYQFLLPKQPGRRTHKNTKSLAAICEELLGVSLSKELQCSDWSLRPLTEEQKTYAAVDAHCLLEIFDIFQLRVDREGVSVNDADVPQIRSLSLEPKDILEKPASGEKMVNSKVAEASNVVSPTELLHKSLSNIICTYGSKILLKESDRKPKASKKKGKNQTRSLNRKPVNVELVDEWQGPVPWEPSNGGDGCAKFLCDVMIEGLAKRLRCVGIDAAVPYSKKPESRELIDQARREKRVLLTRDVKLLRYDYLIKSQIYRVKTLHKDEQLKEVIENFQLTISGDQLMSRCTKCNGRFIQKPLTTEEAIEAAKGFQKIPNCLFNKNLEFWQCMDCKQLYWEEFLPFRKLGEKFWLVTSFEDTGDAVS